MKEKLQVIAERLINVVNESTCAFTATKAAINRLQGAGFEELTLEDKEHIQFVFEKIIIKCTKRRELSF